MATGTPLVGTQTTISQVSTSQMPDHDKYLYLLEPGQAPWFQWLYFSQGINKAEKVINPNGKFDWEEDEYYPYQTELSGAGIAGGSTSEDNIGLSSSNWINEGDILLVEATEQMVYVDSTASSQIDITAIDEATNITAATTGYIKKIGSRNHEFATARSAVSTRETLKTNYCTIFSETVTTSGRYQAGETYTGKKTHKDEVRKKTLEMKAEFERNFMFSTSSGTVTVSSLYRHTFGKGFLGFVTTNVVSYAGTLVETAFDDYLKQVFTAKGSSRKKRHYCGANQLNKINAFVKAKYTALPTLKEYGIDIQRYITPFGELQITWHPQMDGKFADYGFTVDEKGMKLRYMANDDKGSRKFRIEENVETPGTDGKSTKLLADIGIQVFNEELHGILKDSTV